MKFSALVEHVTKKPLPAHVTHFIVEVMASDEEGEDVEVRIHSCYSLHLSHSGCFRRSHSSLYASDCRGKGQCETSWMYCDVALSEWSNKTCIVTLSHNSEISGTCEDHAYAGHNCHPFCDSG